MGRGAGDTSGASADPAAAPPAVSRTQDAQALLGVTQATPHHNLIDARVAELVAGGSKGFTLYAIHSKIEGVSQTEARERCELLQRAGVLSAYYAIICPDTGRMIQKFDSTDEIPLHQEVHNPHAEPGFGNDLIYVEGDRIEKRYVPTAQAQQRVKERGLTSA